MWRPQKYVVGLLGLALLAVMSSCGSTIAESKAIREVTETNESTGLATGEQSVDGGGVVSSGGQVQAGGAGRSATPGAGGTTPTTAKRGLVTTRGVTATTVKIGVGTSDADSFAKTLGLSGLSSGDTKAQFAAIEKELNKRGGILGRKIELVEHKFSTAQSLNDPATASQAACATWTQDNHVFAVFSLTEVTLLECLKKADTPLIDGGAGWGLDAMRIYRQIYERYPNYFNIGAMYGDTYDEIAAKRLVARNFFQGWNTTTGAADASKPMKFGIIVTDNQNGQYQEASITKQLAKQGIKPSLVLRNAPGLANAGANAQSNVLQMKAAGITHIWGAGGTFHQTAEQQAYRPRYFQGIGVSVIPDFSPARQLIGSMTMIAIPAMELGGPLSISEDLNPATTECRKIMRDAGQVPASASEQATMMIGCDQAFFFQAAIQASGNLTTDGLRQGMEMLKNRDSAVTFKSMFGLGSHASAQAMRDAEYRSDCGCYTYASKELHTVAG